MNKKLKTPLKVALITGASKRIGAAIAGILHENSINVMIHYRTAAVAAKKLCAEFNARRPGSAKIVRADLRRFPEIHLLIQKTIAAWGQLDILVNNASCFFKTSIGHVTGGHWDELINTNLKAPFFLAQAASGYLASQQGCIINIADIYADRALREHAVYCISKAGLCMLTKTLARELAPAIRVNTVSPGQTIWPEAENILSPQIKKKILQRTALRRPGAPIEIANAVLFLAKNADYITGQNIIVDGGRVLYT